MSTSTLFSFPPLFMATLRRTCPPGTRIIRRSANSSLASSASSSPIQSFHSSVRRRAYKDDQDKDSLKPGSSEYSKSGKGDDAAAHSDEAFDPEQTSPEQQGSNAEGESGSDSSLNVSPSNKEVSEGKGDRTENAPQQDRKRTSGGGGAPKAGS